MSKNSFEEQLEKYGSFTFRNTGVSMMPLLRQGKDLFTVRRKEENERAKPLDVVLYHRGSQYVLHRVLELTPTGYIIRGDNCLYNENIPEEDIMGIMTEYVRDGKTYSTESREFKNYTKRMLFFSPLRISYGKMKIGIRRCAKRIIKRQGK